MFISFAVGFCVWCKIRPPFSWLSLGFAGTLPQSSQQLHFGLDLSIQVAMCPAWRLPEKVSTGQAFHAIEAVAWLFMTRVWKPLRVTPSVVHWSKQPQCYQIPGAWIYSIAWWGGWSHTAEEHRRGRFGQIQTAIVFVVAAGRLSRVFIKCIVLEASKYISTGKISKEY